MVMNREKKIRLAKPYIPEEAIRRVCGVLESGNLVQGRYVRELEDLVAEYLGVTHALMVSSGTAALHLAVMAAGLQPYDEVIIPAFTYPATANVVEICGAKSVPVDINLSDFCVDYRQVEDRITSRTKAIIIVHEFGQAAHLSPIMEIAAKHGLFVIEDAACGLGSEYEDRKVGTFGDIGCFSLHPRKAITTGEGGIVVTNDPKLAEKAALLRNNGAVKKDGHLDFLLPGLNYRLTEMQAVIGIEQLKMIDDMIGRRVQQAVMYNSMLENIDSITTPVIYRDRKNAYQSYHILIEEDSRDQLIDGLAAKSIETNIGAQALNCLTYYRNKYNLTDNSFPNAAYAYKRGLTLPLGQHLTDEDIQRVGRELLGELNKR